MRIAILTSDCREAFKDYAASMPYFNAGIEALLQGFVTCPDVEVHIVCCIQEPVRLPGKLAENVWYHGLLVSKLGWLRTGYQGCIRAMRRKLKEINPDVVHGYGTERECALAAVFSRFPNVVSIQGNMAELARVHGSRIGTFDWITARLENFTLPRTAGVICNSVYTENLVRSRAKRVWVVHPALRLAFLEPVSNAASAVPPCVILNVGVISPRKRQLELLDVVEALHQRGLKFEFHFIGVANPANAYTAAFLKRIKPMEAAGYARYLGRVPSDELMRSYDSAAGMVHFSFEEAFGLNVSEALARNMKIFGSRLGGIIDIARGVPGAELFEMDDWEGLKAALARWIAQGHPRPDGAAAIMGQRYHPQVVMRRHLEIYREVISTSS